MNILRVPSRNFAAKKMKYWKLRLGNFLFKYRSFTPIPLIIVVFVIFRPVELGGQNLYINLAGLFISLVGEALRVIAVGYSFTGTSGRESYLRADALNTTGIYSVVRNPLYIGNFLIFTGLVVVYANILAIVGFALFLIFQYYFVILAEEQYLKETHGSLYEEYCTRVKRIIPIFKNYKRNRNPFNLKKVIFKENDSLFNLLVMYILVLLYKEKYFAGRISSAVVYMIPGFIIIVGYIGIKIMKKSGSAAGSVHP